jgi:hypothetical protein
MQATIVVQAASAPAPAPSQAAGGTATVGDTAATDSHAAGTHDAGQPDTALELPLSLPWLAPLLIGLGLVALAFGVIPPARESVRVDDEPRSGWRR